MVCCSWLTSVTHRSQLVNAQEFLQSVCSTTVPWSWPWRDYLEYFPHGNPQAPQSATIGGEGEQLLNIDQHTTTPKKQQLSNVYSLVCATFIKKKKKKLCWILTSTLAGTVTAFFFFFQRSKLKLRDRTCQNLNYCLKGNLHFLQTLLPKDFRMGRNLKCSLVLSARHMDLHYYQPKDGYAA